MAELFTHQTTALGFLMAALIGFLVGRTREEGEHAPRPGIRDFIIVALLGALGAQIGEAVLTAAANAGFKSALAITSGQSAFYGRVIAGLLASVAAALAVAVLAR